MPVRQPVLSPPPPHPRTLIQASPQVHSWSERGELALPVVRAALGEVNAWITARAAAAVGESGRRMRAHMDQSALESGKSVRFNQWLEAVLNNTLFRHSHVPPFLCSILPLYVETDMGVALARAGTRLLEITRSHNSAVVKYHALMTILRDHADEIHDEEYRVVVHAITGMKRGAGEPAMVDAAIAHLTEYADAVGAGDDAGVVTILDLINAIVWMCPSSEARRGAQARLNGFGVTRMIVNQMCIAREDADDRVYAMLVRTATALLEGGAWR